LSKAANRCREDPSKGRRKGVFGCVGERAGAKHPKAAGKVYVDAWMSEQRDCRTGARNGESIAH